MIRKTILETGGRQPRGPLIGILAWEAKSDGQLSQLERLQGNVLHPETFGFGLLCRRVEGATYATVVREPKRAPIAAMIEAAQDLEKLGVKAITTSCGFNALFQEELGSALRVPFFSSALLLLPLVMTSLGGDGRVGVLTADSRCLSRRHLEAVGVNRPNGVVIRGLEESREFQRVLDARDGQLDPARLRSEVVDLACRLVNSHPEVRAIVLECTDLPPFSVAIRRATGLPTFDIVTLLNLVYASLAC